MVVYWPGRQYEYDPRCQGVECPGVTVGQAVEGRSRPREDRLDAAQERLDVSWWGGAERQAGERCSLSAAGEVEQDPGAAAVADRSLPGGLESPGAEYAVPDKPRSAIRGAGIRS